MSDEIIIDDKGQVASAGDALAVHDTATYSNAEFRYRLIGLVGGAASTEITISKVAIRKEVAENQYEDFIYKPGADLEAFEIAGGTCSIRGHYDGRTLSLRATAGMNVTYAAKGEVYFGGESCIARKITLWYRKGNEVFEHPQLKPKDQRISIWLYP